MKIPEQLRIDTVENLIKELQKHPPNALVRIHAQSGCIAIDTKPELATLYKNDVQPVLIINSYGLNND